MAFAGISAASARCGMPVMPRSTLVDRRNHHIFQPLLYQVATALLAPSEVSAPIRGSSPANRRTFSVIMAEAVGLAEEEHSVVTHSPGLGSGPSLSTT